RVRGHVMDARHLQRHRLDLLLAQMAQDFGGGVLAHTHEQQRRLLPPGKLELRLPLAAHSCIQIRTWLATAAGSRVTICSTLRRGLSCWPAGWPFPPPLPV